jgi:hypothetical protein
MNDEARQHLIEAAHPDLGECGVCHRLAPFTLAIKTGRPLGQICTCPIEQRVIDRVMRQIRAAGPVSREGH